MNGTAYVIEKLGLLIASLEQELERVRAENDVLRSQVTATETPPTG